MCSSIDRAFVDPFPMTGSCRGNARPETSTHQPRESIVFGDGGDAAVWCRGRGSNHDARSRGPCLPPSARKRQIGLFALFRAVTKPGPVGATKRVTQLLASGPWRPPAWSAAPRSRSRPPAGRVCTARSGADRPPSDAPGASPSWCRSTTWRRSARPRHPAGAGPPGRSGSPRDLRGPRHRRRVLPARPRGPAGPRLALRGGRQGHRGSPARLLRGDRMTEQPAEKRVETHAVLKAAREGYSAPLSPLVQRPAHL